MTLPLEPSSDLLLDLLPEVIAYHGWGFDASCWQAWQMQFQRSGYRFQAFDRGYGGQEHTPTFKAATKLKVLLTHSYGLHLCPPQQLRQANILVIFSGFLQFHPTQAAPKARSERILQQMIDQFQQDPHLVLSNFWAKCSYPEVHPSPTLAAFKPQEVNFDLLLADLQHMHLARLDGSSLQRTSKIVVLHGGRDQIIAVSRGQELAEQFADTQPLQYESIEAAGHALPFTHLPQCWSVLQSQLLSSSF